MNLPMWPASATRFARSRLGAEARVQLPGVLGGEEGESAHLRAVAIERLLLAGGQDVELVAIEQRIDR